jgi:hypothetical protein
MGSGSLSFCGVSLDWNDVLADYEGIVCIMSLNIWFIGIVGDSRSSYMQLFEVEMLLKVLEIARSVECLPYKHEDWK